MMNIEATKGAIRYDGEVVGHYYVNHRWGVESAEIYIDGEMIDRIDRRLLRDRTSTLNPVAAWVEQNRTLIGLLENEAEAVPEPVDVADNLSG